MGRVVASNNAALYQAYVVNERRNGVWQGYTLEGEVAQSNILTGGRGNDTLTGYGLFNNRLSGGDGNDLIMIMGTPLRLFPVTYFASGGEGNDTIDASYIPLVNGPCPITVTLEGGAGNDLMIGSRYADDIDGGLGNDTIYGGAGNDLIADGGNYGEIYGGDGNDRISSTFLSGIIAGENGNDIINIDTALPNLRSTYITVYDGEGNDTVNIGSLQDAVKIKGSPGADRYNLAADRSNFNIFFEYTQWTQSSGANVDVISNFSLANEIDLSHLVHSPIANLHWANNVQGAGNVMLQVNNATHTGDLYVNAGPGYGIMQIHFVNIADYGLNRGSVVLG